MLRLLVLLTLLVATPALAQTADRVVYAKKTVFNLEGGLIDGVVEGPNIISIGVRKRTRFGNIIEIRESFREKLLSSAADL